MIILHFYSISAVEQSQEFLTVFLFIESDLSSVVLLPRQKPMLQGLIFSWITLHSGVFPSLHRCVFQLTMQMQTGATM